jgi:hypothetical protein
VCVCVCVCVCARARASLAARYRAWSHSGERVRVGHLYVGMPTTATAGRPPLPPPPQAHASSPLASPPSPCRSQSALLCSVTASSSPSSRGGMSLSASLRGRPDRMGEGRGEVSSLGRALNWDALQQAIATPYETPVRSPHERTPYPADTSTQRRRPPCSPRGVPVLLSHVHRGAQVEGLHQRRVTAVAVAVAVEAVGGRMASRSDRGATRRTRRTA